MAPPEAYYDLECDVSEAISKDMSLQYSPTSPVPLELECADIPRWDMSPQYSPTSPDVSGRKEEGRAEERPTKTRVKRPVKGIA